MNRLLFLLRTRSAQLTCGRVQTQSLKQCPSSSTPKLPDHVLHLTCPSSAKSRLSNVYVIGTNHVSRKSCEQVRELINSVRPEVVFVELCKSRRSLLADRKIPTVKEILTEAWRNRSDLNMLGQILSFSQELHAKAHNVVPGSEFRVAYEEAIKHGASVVIGDRPNEITLTRARRNMPLREIASFFTMFWFCRLTARLLYEAIRKLLKGRDSEFHLDMRKRIRQEIFKTIPSLLEAILHERDLYMSHALLQVAKKRSCVVAVVGEAHLPGIKKHWQQPISEYICEKVFSKKTEEREALNK